MMPGRAAAAPEHGPLILAAREEIFPIAGSFTIARGSRTEARVVTATLSSGDRSGRGEGVPYARYGETPDSVIGQIEEVAAVAAGGGLSRDRLRTLLPGGAARCAVDAALWDLEAKQAGTRAWTVAGLPAPAPVTTAYTLSLDSAEAMAVTAAANAHRPLLKLKLTGSGDVDRVRAVARAAPDARLIVDANEAWSPTDWDSMVPALAELGVALIEQPFKAGDDAMLAAVARPVPVCADESFHTAADAAVLAGRYDVLNVKLDKTGGLTEALDAVAAARACGLGVMIGCMVGSSLAMAPALLAAQGADLVDLDGPLILATDRQPPLYYDGSVVHPPEAALWG